MSNARLPASVTCMHSLQTFRPCSSHRLSVIGQLEVAAPERLSIVIKQLELQGAVRLHVPMGDNAQWPDQRYDIPVLKSAVCFGRFTDHIAYAGGNDRRDDGPAELGDDAAG